MDKLSLNDLMDATPVPNDAPAPPDEPALQDAFTALLHEHTEDDKPAKADPVVEALQRVLHAKHTLVLHYHCYGAGLACLERDGLYKHFLDHIEDEHRMAYELTRKLVARGGSLQLPAVILSETVDLAKAPQVLKVLRTLEEQSVRFWAALHDAAAGDLAMQGFAQDGAVLDQAHAEDMIRYLGGG